MPDLRLHVRAMVRDGDTAFVGSQSLRALELDARREVGLITRDPKVVKGILDVFDADWVKTDVGKKELKVHEKELQLQEVAS
jgi:phosphatidylserine/phosphatidylglycerophosphate/cardiolipin synthase-like enzyme